jgi:P-type conjugative transfer protein TrbJ
MKVKTSLSRRGFLLSLSIPLAALIFPKSSFASGLLDGATEFTQMVNMVQLVMQYATQIEQYATQVEALQNHIQQTQMMLQNLRNLPAGVWNKFSSDVLALKNIVQQGQAVSFAAANVDTQFASVYKGYANYETSAALSLGDRATTFAQQYKLLNASTRDSTNGALKSLNTQMNAMSSDEAVMNMLQQQSRSADGQLKVVQAANEIALHQTDTLKKLQYTLMTQASTQAAYEAAQNDKETAKDALSQRRQQYTIPDMNRPGNTRRYENFH